MKLANNEREVLEYIQEGINNTSQLSMFTKLDDAHVKNIMEKLEFFNLIKIIKKSDEYDNEGYWIAEVIKDIRGLK